MALAVSGGADSMAMALLAAGWARARGGSILALVVDHGIQPGSAAIAAITVARLAAIGIGARTLTLFGLGGARLAERARAARHAALQAACAAAGLLHLLFGHHAADQAETVAMRRLRGSGPAGLAGMAALSETDQVRKLRPLLDVPRVRLRATLLAAGVDWVEDPANADPRSERARLRQLSRDRDGAGPLIRAAVEAACARGRARAEAERAAAAWLGRHVSLFPQGYAIVATTLIPEAVLAALVATIGGRDWPPRLRQVGAWVADPRPATLGGVRIVRHRDGWLLAREAAAMQAPAPVAPGTRWDGRFVAVGPAAANAVIGPAESSIDGVPSLAASTTGEVRGRLRDSDGSAMLSAMFAPLRPLTVGSFVTPLAGMQKRPEQPILGL